MRGENRHMEARRVFKEILRTANWEIKKKALSYERFVYFEVKRPGRRDALSGTMLYVVAYRGSVQVWVPVKEYAFYTSQDSAEDVYTRLVERSLHKAQAGVVRREAARRGVGWQKWRYLRERHG